MREKRWAYCGTAREAPLSVVLEASCLYVCDLKVKEGSASI